MKSTRSTRLQTGAISRQPIAALVGGQIAEEKSTTPVKAESDTKKAAIESMDIYEEEPESDEDDTNKLYCVCKEPYDGRSVESRRSEHPSSKLQVNDSVRALR